MASIYTYSFLSPAAGGVDINLINSYIETTGAPSVNMKQAVLSQYIDPVTENRDQITLTPPASTAVGQSYSIRIQQVNRGRNISKVFSFTSITGSETAQQICNAFRSVISLDPELSLTASGTTTLVLTAASTGADLIVTPILAPGAGWTTSSAVVNSLGNVVSITTASVASALLTGTTAGVNGTYTVNLVSANLFDGMLVRFTLAANDIFIFADGTTVNTAGATVDIRIGNVVAGTSFQVGVLHDSNLKSCTLNTGAVSRTATPLVSPVRGSGAELANRGIVGAVAANTYGELKINYLEVPPNGGAPISKTHSVFVNGGIPATNLLSIYGPATIGDQTTVNAVGAFKIKAVNALRGAAASALVFNAASESVSLG